MTANGVFSICKLSRRCASFANSFQKGKHIESTLSQNFVPANAGDRFHRLVPGDITAIAIKGEYAVNAGIDQGSIKQAVVK